MKVCLVIQKVAGLRGGAERIVCELAGGLVDAGHEVDLVTFEPADGPPAYELPEVAVVNLFPARIGAVLRRGSGNREASSGERLENGISGRANKWPSARLKWELTHGLFARRLASWLRGRGCDVVVGFLPPAISAVALAGERLGTDAPRSIASIHSVPSADFGDSDRWDQNPVARSTNLRALELVDAITVLQESFIEQLPVAARRSAVVMPNAVPFLSGQLSRSPSPTISIIGRLVPVKRHDLAIRAFGHLADMYPEWTLEIHGEGEERCAIESLVDSLGLGGRVRLCGETNDVSSVLADTAIVVHPSDFEGFGLAVAEAILHGVPVVGRREAPGVRDLVEHEASGLLVSDGGDLVSAIADALQQLIDNPIEPEVHACAAARLQERVSPPVILDRWQRLLSGELPNPPGQTG